MVEDVQPDAESNRPNEARVRRGRADASFALAVGNRAVLPAQQPQVAESRIVPPSECADADSLLSRETAE